MAEGERGGFQEEDEAYRGVVEGGPHAAHVREDEAALQLLDPGRLDAHAGELAEARVDPIDGLLSGRGFRDRGGSGLDAGPEGRIEPQAQRWRGEPRPERAEVEVPGHQRVGILPVAGHGRACRTAVATPRCEETSKTSMAPDPSRAGRCGGSRDAPADGAQHARSGLSGRRPTRRPPGSALPAYRATSSSPGSLATSAWSRASWSGGRPCSQIQARVADVFLQGAILREQRKVLRIRLFFLFVGCREFVRARGLGRGGCRLEFVRARFRGGSGRRLRSARGRRRLGWEFVRAKRCRLDGGRRRLLGHLGRGLEQLGQTGLAVAPEEVGGALRLHLGVGAVAQRRGQRGALLATVEVGAVAVALHAGKVPRHHLGLDTVGADLPPHRHRDRLDMRGPRPRPRGRRRPGCPRRATRSPRGPPREATKTAWSGGRA